jgi:hypothetical protein
MEVLRSKRTQVAFALGGLPIAAGIGIGAHYYATELDRDPINTTCNQPQSQRVEAVPCSTVETENATQSEALIVGSTVAASVFLLSGFMLAGSNKRLV